MAEVSPLGQLELGSLQDEQLTRLFTLADLVRNVICGLCEISLINTPMLIMLITPL